MIRNVAIVVALALSRWEKFFDVEVFKRVCSKKFRASEFEIGAVALYSSWKKKLKNPNWDPFHLVEDDNGNIKVFIQFFNFPNTSIFVSVHLHTM